MINFGDVDVKSGGEIQAIHHDTTQAHETFSIRMKWATLTLTLMPVKEWNTKHSIEAVSSSLSSEEWIGRTIHSLRWAEPIEQYTFRTDCRESTKRFLRILVLDLGDENTLNVEFSAVHSGKRPELIDIEWKGEEHVQLDWIKL